jgi:hypothetical protein
MFHHLSRYGGWVFEQPIELGMKMLRTAMEAELEDRMWLYYCVTLPYQDKKHKMSFSDMMKKLRQQGNKSNSVSMTQDEIDRLADIADLSRGAR